MKVRFFHVDHKSTYACEVDANNKVVAFATAHVSPHDQFCRMIGRVKSEGRLKSPRFRTVPEQDNISFQDFRDDIFALEHARSISLVM
jgi:hypothetical protein